MFAIHGFDESMILGWHCDSNLAARLALYRGRVDTLIDKVFGYHCDHTRVAAANNKGRATRMNDQDQFIWNVASPYVPGQAETWGWPDVEIEELRLDRDTAYQRFTSGLAKAIEPATVPFTTSSLEWQLFEDLTYDLPHTLPFVCDQVVTFPARPRSCWSLTRADFVSGFAKAWKGMGFTGPILIPQECEGLPSDLEGVERAPFADQLGKADLFIFEFGLATQTATEPVRGGRSMAPLDRKRLKVIERLFKRAAATEAETRPAARRVPRRFIGVNVIYNKFWTTFTDYVGANINPFCSQVLAGLPREDEFDERQGAALPGPSRDLSCLGHPRNAGRQSGIGRSAEVALQPEEAAELQGGKFDAAGLDLSDELGERHLTDLDDLALVQILLGDASRVQCEKGMDTVRLHARDTPAR